MQARAKAGFEESWYLPLVEKTGRRRALADAAEASAMEAPLKKG